jgi:hypothetical protein
MLSLLDQHEIGFGEHLHHLRIRLAPFDDNETRPLEAFRGTECNTG